jgi:hypothetical protein
VRCTRVVRLNPVGEKPYLGVRNGVMKHCDELVAQVLERRHAREGCKVYGSSWGDAQRRP